VSDFTKAKMAGSPHNDDIRSRMQDALKKDAEKCLADAESELEDVLETMEEYESEIRELQADIDRARSEFDKAQISELVARNQLKSVKRYNLEQPENVSEELQECRTRHLKGKMHHHAECQRELKMAEDTLNRWLNALSIAKEKEAKLKPNLMSAHNELAWAERYITEKPHVKF